ADALDATVLFRNRQTGGLYLASQLESTTARPFLAGPGALRAAVLNPRGSTLAFGTFDGHVQVFDYARSGRVFDVSLANWSVTQTIFSSDGSLLATLSHTADCVTHRFTTFEILPKGAACDGRSRVDVWNAKTGANVHSFVREQAWAVALSPDGRQLA